MHRSLIVSAAVGFMVLAGSCSAAPESEGGGGATSVNSESTTTSTEPAGDLSKSLDETFADFESRGFEGTVLVRHGDKTVSRGFGFADRDEKIENDSTTIFDIGSVTKQFTAAGILRLEMDGKLSVDDPVTSYVKGLPAEYDEVTLHHLLTHSSGIRDGEDSDEEKISLEAFIAVVSATPLGSAPGEEHQYSNWGYGLLAATILEASGDSYEGYLHSALFEPAGMEMTGYVLPDWDQKNIAVGYEGEQRANTEFVRPNERSWGDDGPYWYLRGSGGILSPGEDMLRWDEALRGDDVLDAGAKEKLFTPHILEGEGAATSYGYGWVVWPTETSGVLITHNGGNGLFFADMLRFVDEDLTIYTSSNNAHPEFANLAYELAGKILETDEFAVAGAPPSCGVSELSDDEIAAFPELAESPDRESAQTAQTFFQLVADGNEQQWREFAEGNVSEELSPVNQAVAFGLELQETLGGAEPDRILEADPYTFHAYFNEGGDSETVISVQFYEGEPDQLVCLEVGE